MNVVKHQYFSRRDRQSQGHAKAPKLVAVERALAHVKYIEHRPGKDRAEDGREVFNDKEDRVDSKKFRQKVREQENRKIVAHKLTLAPEFAPDDIKAYTREVMQELAREKGQELDYIAVAHANTEHPHVHVVILGNDASGKAVRFDKKDYSKAREFADRHLERTNPAEYQRREEERQARFKSKQHALSREERIREGLELPWMHKKVIREQLEPYEQWRKQKPAKEPLDKTLENDKPFFQDTIVAAGKEWSRQNSSKELRELTEYLWDNQGERIGKQEFAKLQGWIEEKERAGKRDSEGSDKEGKEGKESKESKEAKEKDYLVVKGKRYDKNTPYEKLAKLNAHLLEDKKNRLPIEDYNKFRGLMENADRSRWSNVVNKEIELEKYKYSVEGAKSVMPERAKLEVSPLAKAVWQNPVFGMFMTVGSVAKELSSWIPLTDQRDRLKEGRDALEESKRDKVQEHNTPGRSEDRKAQDRETIEKLDQAIEQNQVSRDETNKEKKRKKWEREDHEDPFLYDPWGRY